MLASEIIADQKKQLENDLKAMQAVKKEVQQALEMLDSQIERLEKMLE